MKVIELTQENFKLLDGLIDLALRGAGSQAYHLVRKLEEVIQNAVEKPQSAE